MSDVSDALLLEQIDYYRARAPEYDNWWHRTHQYALPPDQEAAWRREVAELETMIDGWLDDAARGSVLELACGTGIWTTRLAGDADRVLAVDAAPEAIAIAARKLEAAGLHDRVELMVADMFAAEIPQGAFDLVWFSFWLSHVPPARFDEFWALVARALRPGRRAVLIDNKWNDGLWPKVERPGAGPPADPVQVRTDISSGEAFRIVKVYYEAGELADRLAALGWEAHIAETDRFFVAGWATPPGD